ncbi:MAG: hypothetical protein HYU54_11265 [Actinobacteria bacterium]|nr:hypothetical protein [Actinomycetota bacterium]
MADLQETVVAYFCPVCGIELTQSDFDTPEADYFCPFCSSQQTPSKVPMRAGW